jgi:uncharacterized protein YndB with AHSA1/START domain
LADDINFMKAKWKKKKSAVAAKPIVAKAEMLIRRPVADVFEAFVNPAVTSKFWFSKGSGRLEVGKKVKWDWDMYGFSIEVKAKSIKKNARIVIDWPGPGGLSKVEWIFTARPDGTTYVKIWNSGFSGTMREMTLEALDSTEGFTFVLAGAKAWLEHGIQLNLVPDKFPDGLPKG